VEGKMSGVKLARRLNEQIARRGDKAKSVAECLGISSGYLSQLLACDRSFASASEELLRRVARYLQVTPVTCFLLAGKIEVADFFADQLDSSRLTGRAMDFIAESSFALEAGVERQMLSEVKQEIQQLVLLLYQEATDTRLMPVAEEWLYSISNNQGC
jgi:transcriptional regulator with XRE-family HTH domain